jgi:hypothetical protein
MAGVIKGPFDEDGVLDTDEIRPILRSDEPVIVSAPPVVSIATLADATSTVVFELDVALTASYDGSGDTWSNVITSPADGETQDRYDFIAVSAGGIPNFVETSSRASAYFEFDAGRDKGFVINTCANTTFTNDLHRGQFGSHENWWCLTIFRRSDATWANADTYFATRGNTASSEGPGVQFMINSQEKYALRQRTSAGSNGVVTTSAFTGVELSAYNGVIWNRIQATSSLHIWRNSRTYTSTNNFAAQPSAAWGTATIGMTPDRDYGAAAEDRLVHLSFGTGLLTDAEVSNMWDILEARHGRIYT